MASELETNMRTTTTAFVEGVWSGKWTLEKTLVHRAPDCIHTMLPTSLGVPKRDNEEWAAYFTRIEGLIWDAEVRKIEFAFVIQQATLTLRRWRCTTTPQTLARERRPADLRSMPCRPQVPTATNTSGF